MALSIVVPTFRRPAMLAEILRAAAEQAAARGDAEIIVVDNCRDRSAEATVAAEAAGRPAGTVRYVAEPRPGVVHARNTGVAAAQGDFVVFLDDDEPPAPSWLDAFAAAAAAGADAAFGRIVPRYAETPPAERRPLLDRLYARDASRAEGADITDLWARLGTGNSMFRLALLDRDAAFDARFNRTGGEDMRLIRALMARGVILRWAPAALVEEIVPADRMTEDYMRRRRYNQGQLRCLLAATEGGALATPRVAFWMAVGAAQAALYGARWAAAAVVGGDAGPWAARMQGGVGKLMWWRAAAAVSYAEEI